jgi:hypothetical protein
MEAHDYLSLRSRYEPENIRLVIIAESPPASGLYFYNPTGARSEPLFAALMRPAWHFSHQQGKRVARVPTKRLGAG